MVNILDNCHEEYLRFDLEYSQVCVPKSVLKILSHWLIGQNAPLLGMFCVIAVCIKSFLLNDELAGDHTPTRGCEGIDR